MLQDTAPLLFDDILDLFIPKIEQCQFPLIWFHGAEQQMKDVVEIMEEHSDWLLVDEQRCYFRFDASGHYKTLDCEALLNDLHGQAKIVIDKYDQIHNGWQSLKQLLGAGHMIVVLTEISPKRCPSLPIAFLDVEFTHSDSMPNVTYGLPACVSRDIPLSLYHSQGDIPYTFTRLNNSLSVIVGEGTMKTTTDIPNVLLRTQPIADLGLSSISYLDGNVQLFLDTDIAKALELMIHLPFGQTTSH